MKKSCAIGSTTRFSVVILIWALLALVAPASGAEVRATASITPQELYLGDRAVLSVSVEGNTDDVRTPRVPDVAGLRIVPAGQPSQSTRIVNGRLVHQSLTWRYGVSAEQVGEYTIPAVKIPVGDKTLETRQLFLRVIKAPSGDASRLFVKVSQQACWQFEPVELAYRWAVREDIRVSDYALRIPLLDRRDEMTVESSIPSGARTVQLAASGVALDATVTQEPIEGATFSVHTIRLRVYPDEPGELVIPPASVTAALALPTSRRDIWGDRIYEPKRAFAATEGATLRVRALPVEGRPEGFDGAVGRFTVSTKIAEPRAHVDDPLRLTITINGDGLLSKVKRPLLSALPGFSGSFRINETLEPGEIQGESIVFEQVIRPTSADVTEIPPVSFAYFDPDAGRYRIARSEPITITVLPTTEQKIETFGSEAAETPATELTRRPGGIYANVTSYAALVDQTPSLAPLWLLVVPPLAYGAALAATRRRRRLRNDLALARASRAWRAWRSKLGEARKRCPDDGAGFFDALARAVSGYLADKLNLGRGELTAAEVAALVEGGRLPEAVGAKASAILEQCDAARFAPHELSGEQKRRLVAEAEAFGRVAERALRRPR